MANWNWLLGFKVALVFAWPALLFWPSLALLPVVYLLAAPFEPAPQEVE